MSAVVFAFGNRPEIDVRDARELATLLAGRRNLAAQSTAGKIKVELDPARPPVSKEIDLEPHELAELLRLLNEEPHQADTEAVNNLRAELRHHLGEP